MSRSSSVSSQGGATPSVMSDDFEIVVRERERERERMSMEDRIRKVQADLHDIKAFYTLSVSPERHSQLGSYYEEASESLSRVDFDALDQQGRIDYLLLRNYLRQQAAQLDAAVALGKEMAPVLPFIDAVVELCSMRDHVEPFEAEAVADKFAAISQLIAKVSRDIGGVKVSKTTAYRAAQVVQEVRGSLSELYGFYAPYDAQFAWWVAAPWSEADAALGKYHALVQEKLVGTMPDGGGDIVGQPIGREALLAELKAEVIAYSPEELLAIADEQFKWCEEQMRQAADELGFSDWKQALEHVKTKAVAPGEQPQLVKQLAREARDYVKRHDLVTIPPVAEVYTTHMMSAEQQKQSPFFLGGPAILIAYPTADMALATKKMVMRGNNRHFSKATVFHELIPGHRLQLFQADRHRTHRQMLFQTPFFVEGWAMYWEFVLWKRRDFFASPEDRVGTLFWRMHRCARITLSLGFHLGKTEPREAIDYLVDRVGHERSTAEGEVRRWLGGDYGPLYQIGYMVGALQVLALREEALRTAGGGGGEKQFHDAMLKLGAIPIELARAAILGDELTRDHEASWRFYKGTQLNDP